MTLLLLSAALAHDHWIEPKSAPGGTEIRVFLGEHFLEPEPYVVSDPTRYDRFTLDGEPLPILLGDPVLALCPATAALQLVVADARPLVIALEPATWDHYVTEERLDHIPRAAGEPVRERYSRHLKALVGQGQDASAFARQGQALEILPDTDIFQAKRAGFTVEFLGVPLPDVLVTAAHRAADGTVRTWVERTDADGRVWFRSSRPGGWMIRLVHMQPVTDPDVAYRSWWGSLTFTRESNRR